ncbi:MAG TPA: condensation domain-containing protein, partial [Pyrinomonadaceae bacterium]|nr:condensation domain-containing protein [Pyrinomonadaceae bacterium]
PEPGTADPGAGEIEVPRSGLEEVVAGVLSAVLHVEKVGRTESFFDLGGHSLLATQALSRLWEACGVEVPLRALFEQPTVEGLARYVEAALRGETDGAVAMPPLVAAGREGELPLSFAQQRLWFMDQLEPGTTAYNIPLAVRLTGRLDVGALERTLSEVVRRHEVLRTTFAQVEGRPAQVIHEARPVTLEPLDISGAAEPRQELAELMREGARHQFDLAQGPLLHVSLLRLAEEEHVALLTMHHIVSDGWSMGVLVREVAALYSAYVRGEESPLPELPVQYADFAVWQREWMRGEVLEKELAYWRRQLGGKLTVLELPTDRPRPAVQSFLGAREYSHISAETTARLKELSRREGCSLFMTLLAGFQALLARHTGQTDIVVGTDIAGRNRPETEPLIGFFVNQLVMRTDLSGDPSFVELMKRVREVCLGGYAHQDVPFEKLVEELQPERDPSRSPLFQVKFVLQNAPTGGGGLELPGLRMSGVDGEAGTAKFDLLVNAAETGRGLALSWQYSTELFDAETIARLHAHFSALLTAAASSPECRLAALPLASAEELREWEVRRAAQQEDLRRRVTSSAETPELEGYRLSTVQARLWHEQQRHGSHFFQQCAASISGGAGGAHLARRLGEAWRLVQGRHEVLRTALRRLPGMELPLQVVLAEPTSALCVTEVSGGAGRVGELMEEEGARGFDFGAGRVAHARLLRLGDAEHVLVLTVSALAADARSLVNLFDDLSLCDAALSAGQFPQDEPVQYLQFSEWQHELLEADDAAEGRDFWNKYHSVSREPLTLPH